jgi:hypothetical protein
MKKSELIKLIKTQILPELKDFNLHKDKLLLPIDNSIVKGFSFRTLSNGNVEVEFFFQPLYLEKQYFVYTFGNVIRDINNFILWDLEEENNIIYLIKILKDIYKNILLKIKTPLDLYNHFKLDEELGLRYEEALVFTAYKANITNAEDLIKKQITRIENENNSIDWVIAIKSNYNFFLNLDNKGKQEKLLEWESKTIKNLKLEKLYQVSPNSSSRKN